MALSDAFGYGASRIGASGRYMAQINSPIQGIECLPAEALAQAGVPHENCRLSNLDASNKTYSIYCNLNMVLSYSFCPII